ncbi:uncharacterized protein BDW70DRAFT_127824 [Aspergillus foveolatus]|uniref:uncharacterized protein n=1 Tax=Aspergillus foveolatus TaxID=210207 RepID=UPI003CCCB9F2
MLAPHSTMQHSNKHSYRRMILLLLNTLGLPSTLRSHPLKDGRCVSDFRRNQLSTAPQPSSLTATQEFCPLRSFQPNAPECQFCYLG